MEENLSYYKNSSFGNIVCYPITLACQIAADRFSFFDKTGSGPSTATFTVKTTSVVHDIFDCLLNLAALLVITE